MSLLRVSVFFVLICSYSSALDTTIRWGTHKGPSSVLTDITERPSWDANPSTIQLLSDFAGTSLLNTSGGPTTTPAWSKGDLIELGFFASSLGADNAIGGTGGDADTPSTSLFQGTWVPLTSQTYIGQDWSSDASGPEKIDAGDFMFISKYTFNSPSWSSSVAHNNTPLNDDDADYKISESPTDLSEHLSVLTSSTKLGIRFYDLDTTAGAGGGTSPDSDGTTRYNTIMNTNWTWPGSGNDLDMFLHDSTNEDNLDSNLVFEFDNTTYGSGASAENRAYVDGTIVSSHGTTTDLHSSDFTTSITYYSGASDLNLRDSSGTSPVGDIVVSGLDKSNSTNTISGGDANTLTINANAAGSSYEFSGTIQDDSTGNTGLKILKVGSGEQILTGNIDLSSSADSYVNIHQGTLAFDPGAGKTQEIAYLIGSGTLKLDNTSNAGQTIKLGLANTSSKKTFSGNVTLSGAGSNTVNVGGGDATDFNKHQEFSGVVSGAANLKKTGSGKLTLSGSNTFSGGVTIADGGGSKDGGILVAGHNNALGAGTTTIEHGKLAISAGTTVTTAIQGQATNDNTNMKSVIGGGVGNSAGIIDNGSGTQINIGSGNGQIDVLSPGMAHASSMSNGTSDYQVVAGNEGLLTNSIGTIQIDKIGLKSGGVFDWEITDFSGNNADGSDWDVLKFDTLDFDATNDTFDINIYSLASNGSAGGVTGDYGLGVNKTGTSGFKFMEWTGSGTPNGTTEGWLGDQTARQVNAFNVNSDNWAYQNNFYYGDWSVWYEGGSFYLQYSAVPEPSTYFMVTGLLMLPGYNFIRRFRKKNVANGVVENSTESTL